MPIQENVMTRVTSVTHKKKLAWFMVCSENIIFAAANVALSLNRHMPDKEFDIVIYYTSLSRQNRNAILNIKNVIVREFHFPKDFIDKMLANLPKGRWNNENSLLIAAHYEIFKLLDEYETVIWLDSDFSIQGDIYDLVNYGPLGLCKDCCWEKIWSVGDQFTSPIAGYDMTRESDLNALIVVNDQLPNYQNLYNYCYETSIKYARNLKNLDQAVFQLMLQDFNLTPKEIPWVKYACHCDHDMAGVAKIVHFGGERKVWVDSLISQCFPEWFRTHLTWLEYGGSDFDRTAISTRSIYADIKRPILGSPIVHREGVRDCIEVRRCNAFGVLPLFTLKKSIKTIQLKIFGVPCYEKKFYENQNFYNIKFFKLVKYLHSEKEDVWSLAGIQLLKWKSYSY